MWGSGYTMAGLTAATAVMTGITDLISCVYSIGSNSLSMTDQYGTPKWQRSEGAHTFTLMAHSNFGLSDKRCSIDPMRYSSRGSLERALNHIYKR